MSKDRPFASEAVAAQFAAYPIAVRRKMLALRELVFATAEDIQAGDIIETLKWGEPAYLTASGLGSTLRMDWKSKSPDHYALYFNCKTDLIDTFRSLFPQGLKFEGNRALLIEVNEKLPRSEISMCIAITMRYKTKATRRTS